MYTDQVGVSGAVEKTMFQWSGFWKSPRFHGKIDGVRLKPINGMVQATDMAAHPPCNQRTVRDQKSTSCGWNHGFSTSDVSLPYRQWKQIL